MFHPFRKGRSEEETHPPLEKGKFGLWHWVGFSGLLHCVIIVGFVLVPRTPFPRTVTYPVYSVELVGGEKLGGGTPAIAVKASPARKKRAPKARPKPVKVAKKVSQKKVAKKVSPPPLKVKRFKRETPPRVALAKKPAPTVKPTVKKDEGAKKATKKAPKEENQFSLKGTLRSEVSKVAKERHPPVGLSDQMREKLIHAALERVKNRTRKKQAEQQPKNGTGSEGVNPHPSRQDQGAVVSGKGGRGGGVLKGLEFLVYRNRMLNLIKERWAWPRVGKNLELEVTVRFGVLENGDIVGLKIKEKSGDPSYDDSVLRAMRKAVPLPPPPVDYRSDFLNVELTFRPKDLRG